ncbi:MAG TPA: GAF domain-containing protein, partial [Anaerolineae bacterium]
MPELTALTFSPIFERALLYAAIAIATLVAFTNWRRGDARAFREPLIAFFALWFVEGALLVSTAAPALLPPALVQGLDFAAIVLLAWGFLASSLSPRAGGILLGGGLTLATAFSVFSFSIMRLAGSQPAWIDMAWSIGSLVVSASATLALGLRRSPDRTSGSIAAFAALALSAALDLLSLPDLSRVCVLVAFILFPLGLYQRALSDLRSIHETLREFSQSALKQTQELVTLLEASTYLFTSFDLDELSRKVVEHAALGIDADRAVIILTDPAAPQTLRVSSSYPRGSVGTGQTFLLNTQPALTLAMTSGDPLRIGPRGQGAAQLMRLLDIDRLGPMVVQPLATQDNTIGVFVAANTERGREFSDGQIRLLEALGAQIAAAIVNAQLYRGLDAQARELARVLATREHEVSWYTSILESIGDGVIVTDRNDRVVLANSAVPRLLDTPLEYVLNHPLGVIFERMLPLGSAPDLAAMDRGTDVVRAAFEFGDATLNISLTPVHSLSGERLGVVVVIQDVTQGRRHAQNRAQFIERIAQESRTPLETIKGYADLLAKGAAGDLPPAARGFVETIRANAERLSAQAD